MSSCGECLRPDVEAGFEENFLGWWGWRCAEEEGRGCEAAESLSTRKRSKGRVVALVGYSNWGRGGVGGVSRGVRSGR